MLTIKKKKPNYKFHVADKSNEFLLFITKFNQNRTVNFKNLKSKIKNRSVLATSNI